MEVIPEVTKTEKTVHWVGYITLAIGMYFLLYYLWATIVPIKVLDVKEVGAPWAVDTKQVEAGGNLVFRTNFCKLKDFESNVTKHLVGDQGIFTLPDSKARFPVGCKEVVHSHIVPKNVPTGEYILEIHINYHVNQYRDVDYHFTTEPFKVKNSILDSGVE